MSRLRVLARYVAARRRSFADRAALEAWQDRLLARVLRRAPQRYAHYADLFPDGPPRSLTDLPVLEKEDVLTHFAGLNRRGVGLEECLLAARSAERGRDFGTSLRGLSVGLSSGTSGRQTAFLTSGAERDRWAGEVLARALSDGLLAGARITLVLRAGGPLYEAVGSRRIAFTYADLALPVPELLQRVRDSRPTVLVAPPSVLVLLARAEREGEVDAGWRADLARVLSAAEVLEPHDAETIEAGLGVRADQVYQAAEGFLGLSCARGTLHLAEDLVLVEREAVPGAADGRFVPVVTDLVRSSQAVLRRRLGDVLVPGTCDCGDPRLAIARVVGRSDDVLELPVVTADVTDPGGRGSSAEGAAGRGLFFPDFVRAAVLAVDGVTDFRVVQDGDDLTLAVAPPQAFAPARDALAAALGEAGLRPASITATPLVPHDPRSKLRRVRRVPPTGAPDAR
ncbi:F390 synthetase-related protein [Serinibacter arcticus]|uniref:F390 synthetase-related protein n=1 Tax=Serinibacter arcticus TaxID=1655435 RepID=UPI0013049201|nr:F390 synthetase-related protein [Serinibacter arcticus]